MELYLQFGHGMMEHSQVLLGMWRGGTVILSPRDLEPQQLVKLSASLRKANGQVLFDPQFYLPSEDHDKLQKHDYWPVNYASGLFWSGAELVRLLERLVDLNNDLNTESFILPGLFAQAADGGWLHRQETVIEAALGLGIPSKQLYATVALSGDAAKNDTQIYNILEEAVAWNIGGVYLVCEHPKGEYLVSDPNWLANVLDLTAGFRLLGKKVIIGYCNQQMLIAASAGANAIASGTWMNVRSFPPDKFRKTYAEDFKQRTTWYYCPQALSEFKIGFLDIAQKQGILNMLEPPGEYRSDYANILFAGPQPTTVDFEEKISFRHYLQCLKKQVEEAYKESFEETVAFHEQLLDRADRLLDVLHNAGVRGQNRDFKENGREAIDVNRAALATLKSGSGPRLRRNWNSL